MSYQKEISKFITGQESKININDWDILNQALDRIDSLGYFIQIQSGAAETVVTITASLAVINVPFGDNIVSKDSNRKRAVIKALKQFISDKRFRKE